MKYVFGIFAILLISGCSLKQGLLTKNNGKVCFKETCFSTELADDAEERRIGLMNRESLDDRAGMLFVFEQPKARISFRMKNTLIPLDMLRLDTSGQVVYIEQNVPACTADPCPTYGPKAASMISKYVLELNAGKVETVGIKVGDAASLDY